ncbi:MAG: efflux RND transporter periplasmic adaptor subunit [Candidatus Gracilibacteria bacterium]|nr:efflux RND transporter periplasmic adaptor subunit [Candidatus Gracilibacteria bacterium]
MKKYILILILLFILTACSDKLDVNDPLYLQNNECVSGFKIGEIDKSSFKVKGIIISNDVKIVSSPIAGTIDYLDCDAGKEVNINTLIAKVSPDFNNPNIINLSIQKGSLINQKTNLESVKISTISSFDTQISSIDNQILNLKDQIKIIEKNILLTKQSSNLNKNDLENQIISLEKTLLSLENNLELLLKSKDEALKKLSISIQTLLTNIKSTTADNLLKIDEVFGITYANQDLNNKYEIYLSAKNSSLKNKVENDFSKLNNLFKNINTLNNEEISSFLGDLIELNNLSRDAIKESIENIYFTKAQMDSYYSLYLTYGNNISTLKDSLDSLENTKNSTTINYDTQISSLKNQIANSIDNLDNLKTNKIDSVDVGLDLQLSGLDSQLKTLNSNLDNLLSSKSNLQSTKQTQILNLENQILQIDQNIDSLNTNLSARSLYAEVSGIIKQKQSSKGNNIGVNTPLCQIIPNNNSTKIKIYSPIELNTGDKLNFDFNGTNHEIIIENDLVYKDPTTQNYLYESNYLVDENFKDGEILSLSFSDTSITKTNEIEDKIIKIPVGYVKNKINGNFVNINSNSGVIEKEIELGNINGNFVEIKSGLEKIIEICK